MVQKAIKDDVLRYQKTLLVWKAFMDNEITEGVSEEEIK